MGKTCEDTEVSASRPWLLLAEDDLLFSRLFQRFFSKQYPQVEVRVSASVRKAREFLEQEGAPPTLAVLDFNLEDGCSTALCDSLDCPYVLWSADGGMDVRSKPKGRSELEQAVTDLAKLGGFDLPFQ